MELKRTETPPSAFGKFELVEQIGHGGMATVHRAFLTGMGGFRREVVIKRILPDLASDQHFLKMFVEEAKLSALLDHPNIVQIYDFGVIDGTYFLAMEYIEGFTLLNLRKHFRKHRRPFPADAAAFIVHQVCMGLDYTHSLQRDGQVLGLVHRDVSPSNVMISAHGAVKLLDFGIAKAVDAIDDELTRTGTLKGKWSYMSPEQVVGNPLTSRSDIFATGIVLWEILAGRRLFKDKTDYLTLSNVAQARVPSLSKYRPEIAASFDPILQHALARRPEDRYASAEEMAEDLEAVLAIRPFSSSNLATLIAPILFELPAAESPRDLQETSGSRSGSLSASVAGSTASRETRETFSATMAGEREVIPTPAVSRSAVTITVLAGAGVVVVTLAIILAYLLATPGEPSRPGVHTGSGAQPRGSVPPPVEPTPGEQAAVPTPGEQAAVPTPGKQAAMPAPGSQAAGPTPVRKPSVPAARDQVAPDAAPAPAAAPDAAPAPAPAARPTPAARPRPAPAARPAPVATPRPGPRPPARPGPAAGPKPAAQPRPPTPAKKTDSIPDLKSGDLDNPYE